MPLSPDQPSHRPNQRPCVLVVGGAGYIGSHTVRVLRDRGYPVVVLDNLSSGHLDAVPGVETVVGDAGDEALVAGILRRHAVQAVMHFAAHIQVGESVAHPGKYHANNLAATIGLLNAMVAQGVKRFVFSSSAAIFGEPVADLIDESHPERPINPYGRSKWLVEQLLPDYHHAHGLSSVCLRYFNAAGAHPDASIGERHEPETHLIPLAIQAALGQRGPLSVYGSDFPTPDGTCIRDYIHVMDLAEAHALALDHLLRGGAPLKLNLGNGAGYSVRQVLHVIEDVLGLPVPHAVVARRPGDAARLVASAARARHVLGWQPRFPDLRDMVRHAAAWHRQPAHPA